MWKDIPGYDGFEASDSGLIRSKITCSIYIGTPDKDGYLRVHPRPYNSVAIHILVALAHIGQPNGLEVDHKDRNRQNNIVSNLRYATRLENANNTCRSQHGENHSQHKITSALVVEIRRIAAFDISHTSIAKQFGLKRRHVTKIVNRESWEHI